MLSVPIEAQVAEVFDETCELFRSNHSAEKYVGVLKVASGTLRITFELSYNVVRKIVRESIGLRLVFAFIVMLGAVASAYGPGGCSASRCGGSCSMHAEKEPTKLASHGCCAGSKGKSPPVSTKARSSECKCEIRSAPQGTLSTEAVTHSAPLIIVFDQPEAIELLVSTTLFEAFQIYFSGDSSPPIVAYHPDFGRAPPRV